MLFSIISQAQDRTPDEIIAARYRVLATPALQSVLNNK